jgi:hypothetical protein
MTTSGSDGVFASLESRVRSYCGSWPAVFDRAFGCTVYDESGRGCLDFDGMPGEVSLLERRPADPGSGLDRTAAVIVETVQGEGGLNAARRVAACPGGPVLAARRAAGGGRRANGVRPDRTLLQLRIRRGHPRYRLPVQIDRWIRTAVGAHVVQAAVGRLGTGRTQRHLPRRQSRLRRTAPWPAESPVRRSGAVCWSKPRDRTEKWPS